MLEIFLDLFSKDAGLRPATLLKKRPKNKYFPVKLSKFLRTPFFIEHLRWLLLYHVNPRWSEPLPKPIALGKME